MFPIFRKAACQDVPLRAQERYMISIGPDGMDEKSLKQLKLLHPLGLLYSSNAQPDQQPSPRHELHMDVVSSSKDQQSALYESDHDRRKRRKVTPSEHGQTSELEGSESCPNEVHVEASPYDEPVPRASEEDRQSSGSPGGHEALRESVTARRVSRPGTSFPISHGSSQRLGITADAPQDDTCSGQPILDIQPGLELPVTVTIDTGPMKTGAMTANVPPLVPRGNIMTLRGDGTLAITQIGLASQEGQTPDDSNAKKLSNRSMKMRNGRFVQSFIVILTYGRDEASRESTGQRIKNILSTRSSITKTHPFFLVQKTPNNIPNPSKVIRKDETVGDAESTSTSTEPVAWRDLKFSNQKGTMFKSVDSIPPIWPPRGLQTERTSLASRTRKSHVGSITPSNKLKTKVVLIDEHEGILRKFWRDMSKELHGNHTFTPQRRLLSGNDIVQVLNLRPAKSDSIAALAKVHSHIVDGSSPFDRGETSGHQTWATKYAPNAFQEVLQPSCQVLRDWLSTLTVHNVKSGVEQADGKRREKPPRKKRRQKRSSDELDDFIVDDDEMLEDAKPIKNAILITGPTGCGKTASVFAVAKELGFEVFEIHPGMRRSAKDIFDKVGDMTQNHLVQGREATSRGSSVPPADVTTITSDSTDTSPSLVNLLGSKKGVKMPKVKPSTSSATSKRDQKQSLILLEEVDILFDSDKSFWTGVQNLIQHSRRPVVMTCNEISRIPMQDLEFHAVLEYSAPETGLAVEYLTALTAAEGHLIETKAIETLYASKNNDLRASINELSFWCQMTVGSKQGGLDWMFASGYRQHRMNSKGEKLRICSEGTFQTGLDLIPEINHDEEELLRQCMYAIDLPASAWVDRIRLEDCIPSVAQHSNLDQLDFCADFLNSRSSLDSVDEQTSPAIASAIQRYTCRHRETNMRTMLSATYIEHLSKCTLPRVDFLSTFDPITVEKPAFPPSQGRLAPSIDAACPTIALDIAPYVRTIVSFDRCIDQRRDELFGSQGKKARHTRAARAAAEGGDKAHTRAEHWFPKTLDFTKVLMTGNDWPLWPSNHTESHGDIEELHSEVQDSTPAF